MEVYTIWRQSNTKLTQSKHQHRESDQNPTVLEPPKFRTHMAGKKNEKKPTQLRDKLEDQTLIISVYRNVSNPCLTGGNATLSPSQQSH